MKKYGSDTAMMICRCMCITFNTSGYDLFSASKRTVASRIGA